MVTSSDIAFYNDIELGILTLEEDVIVHSNRAFQGIIGKSDIELHGEQVENVVHDESLGPFQNFMQSGYSEGSISIKLNSSNASLRWVRVSKKQVGGESLLLFENITQEMVRELIFSRLAEGFIEEETQSIFASVVLTLTHVLNVKYSFVGIFNRPLEQVDVKALSKHSKIQKQFSYPLEGTPCLDVLHKGHLTVQRGIQEVYPDDQDLKVWNVDGYIGVALKNSQQESIGHLAIMDTKPVENPAFLLGILKIYASRLGVELEKVLSEQELVVSETKYRNLFENAFEAKMIYDDHKKHYLQGNKAAIALFGYPREFFVGLDPMALKPEAFRTPEYNKRLRHMVAQALEGEMLIEETVNKKADGSEFHSEIGISLLDREKRHFLVSIRDVSPRKKVEQELIDHKDKLEELVRERTNEIKTLNEELLKANTFLENSNVDLTTQKEKLQSALERLKLTQNQLIQSEKMASLGILTSGMAHELNNSMNTIMGGISQAYMELEELASIPAATLERIDGAFHWVQEGISRTSKIVKGLASYGYHEHTQKETKPIDQVIQGAIARIEPSLEDLDVIFETDLQAAIELKMQSGQLIKALVHVLENAIYFSLQTENESVNSKVKVTSTLDKKDDQVVINVFNTGKSIEEDHFSRIYVPFFSTKPVGEGTGLGLSVAYSFIEQHSGMMSHENVAGGVLCTIRLPM
ncbi:MAG: PAS domain S-box protein [Cytophagales bacterium]|nr:PAS domain S-box protein [Cytophagales bacterium]